MNKPKNRSGWTAALLASTALLAGGCATAVDTGVKTTPTFAPARYVPTVEPQTVAPVRSMEPIGGRTQRVVVGAKAVAQANRSATVSPDSSSMRGATWQIDQHDQGSIYQVPTAVNRVTTILLPPGERFNGAVGGDVESFLINVAYAGPRPAVSILPRSPQARGNLQLVTTAGFYSFDLLVNRNVALNLVDVGREMESRAAAVQTALPQPEGDFTRLAASPVSGPAPAWAPAEAWADSRKMVVRFQGPLPQLPALFAGQKGEQMVSYRRVSDPQGGVYLVTDRRVTEAELRLDQERLRLTVDPAAIQAGTASDPSKGAEGWQGAEALPGQAGGNNVAVLVMPGANGQGTQATVSPFAAGGSNIPGGASLNPARPSSALAAPGWL